MERDGNSELRSDVEARFNKMLNSILNSVQLLCKSDYQYQNMRSKVLRSVNDAKRGLFTDLDFYDVQRVRKEKVERYDVED
jgi:hypothetical protein